MEWLAGAALIQCGDPRFTGVYIDLLLADDAYIVDIAVVVVKIGDLGHILAVEGFDLVVDRL